MGFKLVHIRTCSFTAQNRDDTNEKINKKQKRAESHISFDTVIWATEGGIVMVKKICGKSHFKLELK